MEKNKSIKKNSWIFYIQNKISAGIGLQIYFLFFIFILLIVIASFISWNSLNEMNKIQTILTKKQIPEFFSAFKLEKKIGYIVSTAPKFLASQDKQSVLRVKALVEKDIQSLSQDIDNTKFTDKKVVTSAKGILLSLEKIEDSVQRVLQIKENISQLVSASSKEVLAINKVLKSEIDNLIFFIYTGFKYLKQKKADKSYKLKSLDSYRALLLIQASGERVANILNNALQVKDRVLLEPMRGQFLSAINNYKSSLQSQKKTLLDKVLLKRVNSLYVIGFGSKTQVGIFSLLESLFDEKLIAKKQLSENGIIAAELSVYLDDLVKGLYKESSLTLKFFESTVLQSQRQLLWLVLSTFLLAFLMGWFFVKKYLVKRVKDLSTAMLLMSRGKLDIPLNLQGTDEISDMANALEVFRDYAIKAQKLNLIEKMSKEIHAKNSELESVVQKLKSAQEQIISKEKLAALGQLTAGIAHEIKNPLNFINNFSLVSKDLLSDLVEELSEAMGGLSSESKVFIEETVKDLSENLERINKHGMRADGIIKGMLQHSRDSKSSKEEVVINDFLDTYINLVYQGRKSSGGLGNIEFRKKYDKSIGSIKLVSQDISQVIVNLITNSCDAIEEMLTNMSDEKKKAYQAYIEIKTEKKEVEGQLFLCVSVLDNGPGIPSDIVGSVFDPFFTTKATDKGTGLGLSLSHDIIVKNNGNLSVKSAFGEFTEFIIRLPL